MYDAAAEQRGTDTQSSFSSSSSSLNLLIIRHRATWHVEACYNEARLNATCCLAKLLESSKSPPRVGRLPKPNGPF